MNFKNTALLLFFVGIFLTLSAQDNVVKVNEKYQIKAVLSPSFENLHFRGMNNIFQAKPSYSAGFEYKYFTSPTFAWSTGILFMNKGFRSTPSYTDPISGEKVLDDGFLIISSRYLGVPFRLNRHIRLTKRDQIIIYGGIIGSVRVSQTVSGRRIEGDTEIEDPLFGTLGKERSNINWFNTMFWGLDFGVGYSKYIKSRLVISIEPIYRRQINEARSPNSPLRGVEKTRLEGIGLDLKMGYYFDKQIDNRNKVF